MFVHVRERESDVGIRDEEDKERKDGTKRLIPHRVVCRAHHDTGEFLSAPLFL